MVPLKLKPFLKLWFPFSIKSVQNQTYKHWEHILVDDASSDTSADIAEAIAKKDARIQIIKRTENKGAAFCRNHATNLAKGEYIAFLDSDDLWHPEKLEQQILQARPPRVARAGLLKKAVLPAPRA